MEHSPGEFTSPDLEIAEQTRDRVPAPGSSLRQRGGDFRGGCVELA